MNYFEIKTDRQIKDELRSVRKNNFLSLIPTARAIKESRTNVNDIEFFVQGKSVSAELFADEVIAMENARIEKQERETKLIWIQQGASHFSGYYKRIKK